MTGLDLTAVALALDLGSVDPLVAVAFALLVGGVAGSLAPVVPGGLLSLGGVGLYWWTTGEPGPLLLSGLVFLAALALAADWFAGAIAAKAGGASTLTTAVATVAGLVAMVFAGPFGFVLVTAATVFALELRNDGGVGHSARAAGVTLLGMLGSGVVQVLLTAGVLVVMVGVAVL